MKKPVFYEQSLSNPDKYILCLNHEMFPFQGGTSGSYAVIFARLSGLHYADFLRMCRDKIGAELTGKNSLYIIPYFKKDEYLIKLVDWLNNRAMAALSYHRKVFHEDSIKL